MTSKESSNEKKNLVLPPSVSGLKQVPVGVDSIPAAVVPNNLSPPPAGAINPNVPASVFGMHQGPFNMINMPASMAGKTGSHGVLAAVVGGSVARPRSAHPVAHGVGDRYNALGHANAPIIPRVVPGQKEPPQLPTPDEFIAGILAGQPRSAIKGDQLKALQEAEANYKEFYTKMVEKQKEAW